MDQPPEAGTVVTARLGSDFGTTGSGAVRGSRGDVLGRTSTGRRGDRALLKAAGLSCTRWSRAAVRAVTRSCVSVSGPAMPSTRRRWAA